MKGRKDVLLLRILPWTCSWGCRFPEHGLRCQVSDGPRWLDMGPLPSASPLPSYPQGVTPMQHPYHGSLDPFHRPMQPLQSFFLSQVSGPPLPTFQPPTFPSSLLHQDSSGMNASSGTCTCSPMELCPRAQKKPLNRRHWA